MPVTYEIDEVRSVVRIKAQGSISLKEDVEMIRTIIGDSRYKSGMATLLDFRERETSDTEKHIRELASLVWEIRHMVWNTRVAIVVAEVEAFQNVSFFTLLIQHLPIQINIFHDLMEAETWIYGDSV